MKLDRRGFLTGLGVSLIAAPAVVRAASLMPVRGIVMPTEVTRFLGFDIVYPEYGLSPAMLALPDVLALNTAKRKWLAAAWLPRDYEEWPFSKLAPMDFRTLRL